MVRVTKKGGLVAAIVQNRKHPFAPYWLSHQYPGFSEGPPMHPFDQKNLKAEFQAAELADVKTDGIYPWHSLTLWPRWYQKVPILHTIVYLVGRFLDLYIPSPKCLRRRFGIQLLAVGKKL